jgi:signal recognition particle receptor subunit beta
MADRDEDGRVVVAKIVLTGVPGSGKSAILQQVADRYAHSSVSVGDVAGGAVFRTEFFWPEVLRDGRRLRVRLFAVSGHPCYNAVDELLLADCDGIVFVTGVTPESLARGRVALRTLVFNAGRNDYELDSRPIVFHYAKADRQPGFLPEQADEALGIPAGSVVRFVTGTRVGEDLCQAVEWVVAWVGREQPAVEEPALS